MVNSIFFLFDLDCDFFELPVFLGIFWCVVKQIKVFRGSGGFFKTGGNIAAHFSESSGGFGDLSECLEDVA